MIPNCTNCGRANGFLCLGDNEENTLQLCIDCYEKLQSINLKTAYFHQYAAWEAEQMMNEQFESFGVKAVRRPAPPAPTFRNASSIVNNINVSGSQVGSINTGNIGSLALAVNQLKEDGQVEIATTLNDLLSAIIATGEFSDAVKNEVVELLQGVAREANVPRETRKSGIAKALMRRLDDLLGNVSSLSQLLQKLQRLAESIFS